MILALKPQTYERNRAITKGNSKSDELRHSAFCFDFISSYVPSLKNDNENYMLYPVYDFICFLRITKINSIISAGFYVWIFQNVITKLQNVLFSLDNKSGVNLCFECKCFKARIGRRYGLSLSPNNIPFHFNSIGFLLILFSQFFAFFCKNRL